MTQDGVEPRSTLIRASPLGRVVALWAHFDHINSCHRLEKVAGHMWRGPIARRSIVDLAGIDFGIRDEQQVPRYEAKAALWLIASFLP